jgi:hypothetical protein
VSDDERTILRPIYTRHYEFPEEPDPEVRAELDHLLRRLSRAKGADREAIDLEIDKLVAKERARQLESQRSRGGPPSGLGLTIEAIRTALREWPDGWPPTQVGLTDYSDRRVRQELEAAHTTWNNELAAAEVERER